MIKIYVNKLCSIDRGQGRKAIFAPGNTTVKEEFANELILRGCASQLETIEETKKKDKPTKKKTKKKSTYSKS